jgi:hypothetical protein
MAKVGFWLRGARGKLAGSVLMKGENGTVARENVSPANPKTKSQALQRAVFATVSKMAAVLNPVINNSFDGAANGKMSRRAFVKKNTELLRTRYIDGKAVALLPKNSSLIAPNALQISDGSLGELRPVLNTAETAIQFFESNTNVTLAKLNEAYAVEPGDQITIVGVYGPADAREEFRVKYARFVIGDWCTDSTEIIIKDGDNYYLNVAALDDSKTEGFKYFEDGKGYNISGDGDHTQVINVHNDSNDILFGDGYADDFAQCAGLIISRFDADKGEWIHTKSIMNTVNLGTVWLNNDTDVIPTYMNSGSRLVESDYYTEQAVGGTTAAIYNSAAEAIQGVIKASGYNDKALKFDSSNTYGPIPEGNWVTITLVPKDEVEIKSGTFSVLNGESAIDGLTIAKFGSKNWSIMFPLPTGSATTRQINVTFDATWNNNTYHVGFRDTIQVVQN